MPVTRKETPIAPPAGRIALSTREAAFVLGISVRYVEKLISDGRLPSFHIGQLTRISRDALDEFITASESMAVRGAPAEVAG